MTLFLGVSALVFLGSTVCLGVMMGRDAAVVSRTEFDQLGELARTAMDTALNLDARVRVLEGAPPRPDSTVDPEA